MNLGREYAPNVKWVWSPNRADEYTTKYYPGDEYVDYVGLTLNNTLDSRESFQQFYENEGQRDYLEAYNKPIIFGEIAEHSTSDEVRNEYIQSVFDYLGTYDKCIGFISVSYTHLHPCRRAGACVMRRPLSVPVYAFQYNRHAPV